MKHKNILLLILLLLAGFLLGVALSGMVRNTAAAGWLSCGTTVGVDPANPVRVNLAFLTLVFGCQVKINVAEVLLMAASLLVYRKLG